MKAELPVLLLWLLASAAVAQEQQVTAIDIRQMPKPLSSLLKVTPDCSPLDNVIMERSGVTRVQLPGDVELYRVPCWANDQNTVERYFRIDQGVASPLLFAAYGERSGWTGTAELPNSHLDPLRSELTMHGKPDSTGNCGSWGVWRWQDGAFHMIELRYQPGCDSGGETDPAQWPVIYKAKGE